MRARNTATGGRIDSHCLTMLSRFGRAPHPARAACSPGTTLIWRSSCPAVKPAHQVMSRLLAGAEDVEWSVSLVSAEQQTMVEDLWAPHNQLAFMLAVETE